MNSLSPIEVEKIYELVEKITGMRQIGTFRKESLSNNVLRRIQACNQRNLAEYLRFVKNNPEEFKNLISAITIHKTGWFRELDVFRSLNKYASQLIEEGGKKTFKVLSMPCSSGEEPYSIALLFELLKETKKDLNYDIIGEDIDPRSIKLGSLCLFKKIDLPDIPPEFRKYILNGKEDLSDYFTLPNNIRDHISFDERNIFDRLKIVDQKFDCIFCRNLLIYFEEEKCHEIIRGMLELLSEDGIIIFGLTEPIGNTESLGLVRLAPGCYIKKSNVKKQRKKRILVIDDNKVVRYQIKEILDEIGYECILCSNCNEADSVLEKEHIDLITLDLLMPEMDGDVWLEKKRHHKIPIIMITNAVEKEAERVLKCLHLGAKDYISKESPAQIKSSLVSKIPFFLNDNEASIKESNVFSQKKSAPDLILIGASTGGPEALKKLLFNLPKRCPPIIIVQHILSSFSKKFAEGLVEVSNLELIDIKNGGEIKAGQIYIPLEEKHIGVKKRGGKFVIYQSHSSPINSVCPSIDFLFESAINFSGTTACFLLTGMGKDGADGLLKLKNGGAMTFVQDEKSSVVFGMPKEAIKNGSAGFVGNIEELRQELMDLIRRRRFHE